MVCHWFFCILLFPSLLSPPLLSSVLHFLLIKLFHAPFSPISSPTILPFIYSHFSITTYIFFSSLILCGPHFCYVLLCFPVFTFLVFRSSLRFYLYTFSLPDYFTLSFPYSSTMPSSSIIYPLFSSMAWMFSVDVPPMPAYMQQQFCHRLGPGINVSMALSYLSKQDQFPLHLWGQLSQATWTVSSSIMNFCQWKTYYQLNLTWSLCSTRECVIWRNSALSNKV